jgi:hypothetical protein
LIEARSIDGLSGSPVFAFTSMFWLKDGKIAVPPANTFFLIGILLGHNQVINPTEVIEIVQGAAGRPRKPKQIPIPLNTGIGIVLPIEYAVEAVDQDKLRLERKKTLAEKKQQSTYVPDAAPSPEAPTSDENPQHRETFTRLVRAAAKSKPSGGRT